MGSIDIFDLVKNSSLAKIKKNFNLKLKKEKDENEAYLTFYAALRGNLDIFKYLLSQKVPIRGSDREKNTILFYAIKGNNTDIVKLILEQSINVNQLNKFGAGVACYLDKETKVEIIELFIKSGLNINTKYKIYYNNQKKFYTERTILLFALKAKNTKIIKLLVDKRVNFSTSLLMQEKNIKKKMFYYILYYSDISIVRYFIKNGINTKVNKNDIKSLANLYLKNNNLDLMKLILNELNHEIKDFKFGKDNRYNALTYSIKNNSSDVTKLLVELGFDNDSVDDYLYKPICYAVKHNEIKTVELLSSDNLNYVVDPCYTLLEMASENKNKNMVKYILNNSKFDAKQEFNTEVQLDFGPEISIVYNIKNHLSSLINYDFGISYIKKAIKRGAKVYDVHLLQAITQQRIDIATLLIKTNKEIDLLKENEINTETILSFMIKRCDIDSILDFLKIAIKENYLLYYILKFEYEEVFNKLDLHSNNVIPEFNIKKPNPIIPLIDEEEDDNFENNIEEELSEEQIPSNHFILDFGSRIFQVYFSNKDKDFIIIDNKGISYKNLPKAAKKDNYQKASKSISFFNKYKLKIKNEEKTENTEIII